MRKKSIQNDPDNNIRNISFFSPAEGFIAYRDFLGYTADSGKTIIQKPVTLNNVDYNGNVVNVTGGFTIKGVVAFDKNHIITYGDYALVPSILTSHDGGNSFRLVFYSNSNAYQLRTGVVAMSFPEMGLIGYAVDADRVLKTTDKGETWTKLLSTNAYYLDFIEPINNNLVFFGSRETNRFIKTPDGGKTWPKQQLPVPNYLHVTFISETQGWVSATDAQGDKIYATTNGTNWVLKNDPVNSPFAAYEMNFINDSTGYAVVDRTFDTYKTTDGGKIWQRVRRDNDFGYLNYDHEQIFTLGQSQVWVGGGYGLLEMTSNGGGRTVPTPAFKIDSTNIDTVRLINLSKPEYQFTWIVNGDVVGSGYNASYTRDNYMDRDTISLIIHDGSYRDTLTKYQSFAAIPYPAPQVISFSPATGGKGTQVEITGKYFAKITQVLFGDVPAASYKVNSLTSITAIPGDGGNGAIKIISAAGFSEKAGYIHTAPPTISSFSPLKGPVGSIVTINGDNFDTDFSKNIVRLGDVKATVISGTRQSLKVKVPSSGTFKTIAVTANGHTAYSKFQFNTTFNSGCGYVHNTFKNVHPGPGGYDTYVVDLDNDGKLDLINTHAGGFFITPNLSEPGNVKLGETRNFPEHPQPTNGKSSLITADLNGDFLPEIIVASDKDKTFAVYKNYSVPGQIDIRQEYQFKITETPVSITVADFDMDGRPDIALLLKTNSSRYANVYRNAGTGDSIRLVAKLSLLARVNDEKLVSGDLNGDNKPDLILVSGGLGHDIYRNTSTTGIISFAPRQVSPSAIGKLTGAMLLDLDEDGKLDLLEVHDGSYAVPNTGTGIYRNISTIDSIIFDTPIIQNFTPAAKYMEAADFDGNGKPDVAVLGLLSSTVQIAINKSSAGNISFPETLIQSPESNGYMAIGDIDSDGKPDIVSAATGIYRNQMGEINTLLGKDTAICFGQAITLNPVARHSNGYWTSSKDTTKIKYSPITVTPGETTSYFYTAPNNSASCFVTDTLVVQVGPSPATLNGGKNDSICKGETIILGTDIWDSTVNYYWTSVAKDFQSQEKNPKVSPVKYTEYILNADNGFCVAKDTVIVRVYDKPVANAGPDKSICAGIEATIGSVPINGQTYSWTSTQPDFKSSAAQATILQSEKNTYYLAASNPGCTSFDTVTVDIGEAPVVNAGNDVTVCKGSSIVIGSPALPGYTYSWANRPGATPNPTGANPSVTPIVTTTYILTANNGNCAKKDTVIVTVSTLSGVNAGRDTTVCSGSSVELGTQADPAFSYAWTSLPEGFISTEPNPVVRPATSTRYVLNAVSAQCTFTDTVSVTTIPIVIPAVSIVTSDSTLCPGTLASFNAKPINQGSSPIYQWYKNGVAVGANTTAYQTYDIANGDKYYVTMTSDIVACVTQKTVSSNVITIAVGYFDLPSVTLTGNTTVKTGETTLLTSSVTNGSINLRHQWEDSTSANGWKQITGETGPTINYLPLHNGDKLRSVILDSNACKKDIIIRSNSLTFKIEADTAVGTPAGRLGIRYYPNPVNSTLTIDSLKISDQWQTVEISDLTGRQKISLTNIANQTKVSIPVNRLPQGYYMVILRRKDGSQSFFTFLKM